MENLFDDTLDPTEAVFGLAAGHKIVHHRLSQSPHFLIGGRDGFGKTTLIKQILISLTANSQPYQLRFVIVDPSGSGFYDYRGNPYMLVDPIVGKRQIDKKTSFLVQYLQILARHRLLEMAKIKAKNFFAYNQKARHLNRRPWPYLVVVLDDFSALNYGGHHKLEKPLTKLAILAKKIGLSLIIATSQIKADVIGDHLRSQIFSRICFGVFTFRQAALILGKPGAENLKKPGVMLMRFPTTPGNQRYRPNFITSTRAKSLLEDERKTYGTPPYLGDPKKRPDPTALSTFWLQAILGRLKDDQKLLPVDFYRLVVDFRQGKKVDLSLPLEKDVLARPYLSELKSR